jgi:predicted SnoaL-like aldol condensation-catalyzing enzyme
MQSISELNKRKVQLFIEAVWNRGRLELIDQLVAADYVGHVPSLDPAVIGPEGVRRLVSSHRAAHPDLYVKIEDQIAEDDRVVTRWHAMTAGSPLARRALAEPTPCCSGITIIRLLAGKQVDEHTQFTRASHRFPNAARGPFSGPGLP